MVTFRYTSVNSFNRTGHDLCIYLMPFIMQIKLASHKVFNKNASKTGANWIKPENGAMMEPMKLLAGSELEKIFLSVTRQRFADNTYIYSLFIFSRLFSRHVGFIWTSIRKVGRACTFINKECHVKRAAFTRNFLFCVHYLYWIKGAVYL